MFEVRKGGTRGTYDHGWLKTAHSFAFNQYYDEKFVHFRTLRVINEDVVAPSKGFPTHSHKNMEILTLVLEGELHHKDSMGTVSVLKPGQVQLMSAGTGVTHSEYNGSEKVPLHLYQIWLLPEKDGFSPNYQEKTFAYRQNEWNLIASQDKREGSLEIRQKANILFAPLESGKILKHRIAPFGYLQVLKGHVAVNGSALKAGDAISMSEANLTIESLTAAELLLFELN